MARPATHIFRLLRWGRALARHGALPTVVAGLTDRLVVAVPTSVGYGAAFEGLAALLTMLTACAPGVLVVNIDNGFGAGVAAARIVHTLRAGDRPAAQR